MRDYNISLSRVMPHRDLSYSRTKSLNLVGDIPKKDITINNSSWINNDVRKSIARRQRAYDERKRNNTDETSAEYYTYRRLVKRAVKQAKRNKEMNVARLCKTSPKGFYSYINERRIVKDNVGSLKTPTGQLSPLTMTWPALSTHTSVQCSPTNN